ncbi:MAG: hypothetical protein ISP32_06000 [Thermoleophilia bacterium]|nr:hypothetical protein [Thermoleophilia bacterium]
MIRPTTVIIAAAAGAVAALVRGVRQPGPPLPGDRLVRAPLLTRTMRASMPAPPERVWPWLAQLGAGRGGWYAIDRIDNGGVPSARHIDDRLQRIAPSDRLEASTFGGPPFVVTQADEPTDLVMVLRARAGRLRTSYAYHLQPDGRDATLLTARLRMNGRPRLLALAAAPLVLAGHEVAQRVQFLRLRRRISGR